LTAKQTAFLQAMLEETTIGRAAEKAGINRHTATKYLQDREFSDLLTAKRLECINDSVRYMQGRLAQCAETLMQIIDNPRTSPQVKVNAINAVFTNCKMMTETADILTKLDEIEKRIEDSDIQYS